jgi:hypothetical protein
MLLAQGWQFGLQHGLALGEQVHDVGLRVGAGLQTQNLAPAWASSSR